MEQMAQIELVIFFHGVTNIDDMRTETNQHFSKALNIALEKGRWKKRHEQKEQHWLKVKIILVQENLIP